MASPLAAACAWLPLPSAALSLSGAQVAACALSLLAAGCLVERGGDAHVGRYAQALVALEYVAPLLAAPWSLWAFARSPWALRAPLVAGLCLSYGWRTFCVNLGGHRYFAHRSFRCHALLEAAMAMTIELSTASLIYWLNFHAHHHAHCDTHRDLHTPDYTPFALTHNIAVWFTPGAGADGAQRADFYAALQATREANRAHSTKAYAHFHLPYGRYLYTRVWFAGTVLRLTPWAENAMVCACLGPQACFWLALLPKALATWATTAQTNFGHCRALGDAPFRDRQTPTCHARNIRWLALLNGGEGWHANHHAFPKALRHGFSDAQLDWSYDLFLSAFRRAGMVHDEVHIRPEVAAFAGVDDRKSEAARRAFARPYEVRFRR